MGYRGHGYCLVAHRYCTRGSGAVGQSHNRRLGRFDLLSRRQSGDSRQSAGCSRLSQERRGILALPPSTESRKERSTLTCMSTRSSRFATVVGLRFREHGSGRGTRYKRESFHTAPNGAPKTKTLRVRWSSNSIRIPVSFNSYRHEYVLSVRKL